MRKDTVGMRVRTALRRHRPQPAARPSYRYLVVVTYGRSGSTLIQGLLNTLPRTLVRGENNFYLLSLFHAWARIVEFRRLHLSHHPRASHSAFFGLHEIQPDSLVRDARRLLTRHLLGSVDREQVEVLGFKEVLWHQVTQEETDAFFDYLDQVFPGCLYVLNTREHDQVVGSGFWQGFELDHVTAKIARVEALQDHLRATRPDRVLDLRYELVTSPEPEVADAQLRSLAEFVHGSCDDDLLAALRATRETGHGPFPFGASRRRAERRRSDGGRA